ncbi:hypothetical protein PAEPH01_2663, partial [Pancytospora epiphaga]
MTINTEEGGRERHPQRRSNSSKFHGAVEAAPPTAEIMWESTKLQDEEGFKSELPEKNMWINEQDDFCIAEETNTGGEVRCPPDIAVIYPPTTSVMDVCGETEDSIPTLLEEADATEVPIHNEDKQTHNGGDVILQSQVLHSYKIKTHNTVDSINPPIIKETSPSDSECLGDGIDAIHDSNIPSDPSFECSEDRSPSKSQSLCDSAGVRKGRFLLKPAEQSSTEVVSTLRYRRGRFHVTETMEIGAFNKTTSKMVVGLLSRQNKQIDMLFDMVKNISGEEKL